jgi:hypothetical protein
MTNKIKIKYGLVPTNRWIDLCQCLSLYKDKVLVYLPTRLSYLVLL